MSGQLDIVESPYYVTAADKLAFPLDTSEYGGSPTSVVVVATNLSTGFDVTSQVLSGSASVSGDIINLPTVQNLVARNEYAIDIQFVSGGHTRRRRWHLIVEF